MLNVALSCKRQAETGRNCSWHDFASSILTSGIPALCLYGAIQLCTKHMAGFLASSESSPSLERMEFRGNFLSKWNFAGILFCGFLARIAEYLLNGSLREVNSTVGSPMCNPIVPKTLLQSTSHSQHITPSRLSHHTTQMHHQSCPRSDPIQRTLSKYSVTNALGMILVVVLDDLPLIASSATIKRIPHTMKIPGQERRRRWSKQMSTSP